MAVTIADPVTNSTTSSYASSDYSHRTSFEPQTSSPQSDVKWDSPTNLSFVNYVKTTSEPMDSKELPESKFKALNSEDSLMNVWVKYSVNELNDFTPSSIGNSLKKSERYMQALYSNDEYRRVISMHLLNLKSGSELLKSNANIRTQYSRLLKNYWDSQRKSEDRMQLMRSLRAMNISPSGA